MSTIIERTSSAVRVSASDAASGTPITGSLQALGRKLGAALANFGNGLGRSFEASRQAAHVTERYLRMTNEQLAGRGLTRRDIDRRIRDITCRDV